MMLARARAVEAAGWDSLWVPDHFMPPATGYGPDDSVSTDRDRELTPTHECWSLLAGFAASIPRVRIGAMVTGNTYRHPAVLAKQAATVDHISGGRLVLGLGAGWQENEHQRYGLEFGTVSERADRLDEACAVISGLFANERTDFQGSHYRLTGALLAPKPLQNPLPIMIGGKGKRRTLPTTVRYAHEWNGWCTPREMRDYNSLIDRLCADADRDPAEIQRSVAVLLFLCDSESAADVVRTQPSERPRLIGTVSQLIDQVAEYAAAGTDEIIIPDFNLSPSEAPEVIQRFMAEVASAF